jgi:hypothetical protein
MDPDSEMDLNLHNNHFKKFAIWYKSNILYEI